VNEATWDRDVLSARLDIGEGRLRMVLDTDTYNEIDDQFAVVHALLSPEKLQVESLYAAPFHNDRSSGPEDGMERSYEEILRLLERLDKPSQDFVHKGSTSFMTEPNRPLESAACEDLIQRASETKGTDPLYVVAVGAITNVASAILLAPEIVQKIVVVWLGGQPYHWPQTKEFNLGQDPHSARVVFDSGVPLLRVPCHGVASHLLTSLPELKAHIAGKSAIGDYLVKIFQDYTSDHYAYAKEIWDVSAVAWLLDPSWILSAILPSPLLKDDFTWAHDPSRHPVREATFVHRNPIFRDLFRKIDQASH